MSPPPLAPRITDPLSVQRQLRAVLPGADWATELGDRAIEAMSVASESPRLVRADTVEGPTLRAHRVSERPVVGFDAFLDGTQKSRVIAYVAGIPIVHGTVGAVIRVRRNRRMATWRHAVSTALYAPRSYLAPELWENLQRVDLPLVDTTSADRAASPPSSHPLALSEAAIHNVQQTRERLEHRLAEEWCALESGPLFIDGGIGGSDRVARASCTVGVIKSHRALYAEGAGVGIVLGLRAGERSSVFRVTSRERTTVASWYLRLRDPASHDPMWGLVRVEIANPDHETETTIGARADEVSRWLLAEVAPLALPDARWDRMVYGVRDCEEFLRAIV